MLRAEKRKQKAKMKKKNYRQSLNKNFFEQLWKVVENTKVVHYFDNSNGNFFFEAKISTVWLQIKFKMYRQVEGATCQCQTGDSYYIICKMNLLSAIPKTPLWIGGYMPFTDWSIGDYLQSTTRMSTIQKFWKLIKFMAV